VSASRRLILLFLFSFTFLVSAAASADVFRPAYFELREQSEGRFEVLLKTPAKDEQSRLALNVVFPEGVLIQEPISRVWTGGALLERYQVLVRDGLDGKTIRLEGNATEVTELIARVVRLDGTSQVERLTRGTSSFVIKPAERVGSIAWTYTVLGIEHILVGIDHLLFVLSLLLVVRGARKVLTTITAFTVAHSLTLALASLKIVQVPGPPVEAIIALSIVFVASEAISEGRGRAGLTSRAPWVVALTFGLLHGLGFAGALAEVGLPERAIPLALFMFNVGVEIGQVVFVASVLIILAMLRRLEFTRSWPAPQQATTACAYAVGTVASFWVFERVLAFL
jgi:hypothetical protein